VDEDVQVFLIGGHGREDLAAYPEGHHVEVRLFAGPWEGQRESPRQFQVDPVAAGHPNKLTSGPGIGLSTPARLPADRLTCFQRRNASYHELRFRKTGKTGHRSDAKSWAVLEGTRLPTISSLRFGIKGMKRVRVVPTGVEALCRRD